MTPPCPPSLPVAPLPPSGRTLTLFLCLLVTGAGCRQEMYDQRRIDALQASHLFPDGMAARPIPAFTIARNDPLPSQPLLTGTIGTNLVTAFPLAIDAAGLARGRQSFTIFCAPCHGATGEGNGMIVQRGFPAPPSYHTERLRQAPVGHFYDVIRRGYGVMYSYAARVPVTNRWEIAAYIRALQLSRNGRWTDVPHAERVRLADTDTAPGRQERRMP